MATATQQVITELKHNTSRDLAAYKTNINQLFRICMEVMSVARAMNAMVYEMELLAMNGVVHAAKVSGGQGKPLLALGEILTDLPSKISPEVRELENWCHHVSKNTAKCAAMGRHHYQEISSLVATLCRHLHENELAHLIEEISGLNLTRPSDITRFLKSSLCHTMSPPIRDNMWFLANRCQDNSTNITSLLKQSIQCLEKGRLAAENIKAIGTTARYLALYISIEAASLSNTQTNFNNLAQTITETIDHLDEQFARMSGTLLEGCQRLKQLIHEERYEKSSHS